MKDFFKKRTWVITAVMFLIATIISVAIVFFEFGFNNVKITSASADNNVSGWAWNSNIGWISFNCTNDSPACSGTDYGVNINSATGNFSGYAWSSNVGWIDFGPTSGFPEAPLSAAHYDSASGAVTGWAKILSMGDDGWVKLSGDWTNGVLINSSTGELSGWAWNANDNGSGIGWISFNCSNDSSCGSSDYKVLANVNQAPEAIDLTAPNWSYEQAGQYGALNAKLNWIFNDSDPDAEESAYQIIINTSDNAYNPLFDSGKCSAYDPDVGCKIIPGVGSFPLDHDILDYGTSYYWWVKTWDNNGVASDLAQYNTDSDTPEEADDGVAKTFTTYSHEMPDADFTMFPAKPSTGEEVKLYDSSKVYSDSAPSTPIDCTDSLCSWLWSATGGAEFKDGDISTSTPTVIFSSTNAVVTLTVTDNKGYRNSISKPVGINSQLPNWKEVKPE